MNKQSAVKAKPIAALLSSGASYASVPVRSIQMQTSETQVVLDVGFPPPMTVAVANTWHINKYYYEATEDRWYVVVNAYNEKKISKWVMRPVDEDGRPVGDERFTSVDLWADRFADRPFDVTVRKVPETFDWFKNFVAGRDIVAQLELFDGYEYRLRYCSSFDALVRLGLVAA